MKKKKNKKKREKHILGKKEFIFNFLSLVIVIGICLYFGGRSLYYYSLQNITIEEEAQTLNGMIIQNNSLVQDDEEGLHLDTDGHYFKGNVQRNYVLFANRLFRVIRVNSDNSVKLVSENYVSTFMWGEDSHYQNSNVHVWLEKKDGMHSGVYYDTIPDIKEFLVKTSYSEDILEDNNVKDSSDTFQDYVTTLTVRDYITANGKNSFFNNGKVFYLLGLNENEENLYVEDDGSIQTCDSLEGYGIRAVITLKSNLTVTMGDGTIDNPYVISQNSHTNYVDSYVKLGDDVWRVYSQKDGVLRMYKNDYIRFEAGEAVLPYSSTNSIFDLNDPKNIAFYLNGFYYSILPYQSLILDSVFDTGEISDDRGYQFSNIYDSSVVCKVGLLNIFDYQSNNELENYFYLNLTSEIGSMEYDRFSTGVLEESDVREEKHIVPVISIDSSILKGGSGTLSNPYVVE